MMSRVDAEIDAKAKEASRWAVIPLRALDADYAPTLYEERYMRQYAKVFTNGARWALELP